MYKADAVRITGMNLRECSQREHRELATLSKFPTMIKTTLGNGWGTRINEREIPQLARIIRKLMERVHQARHVGELLEPLQHFPLTLRESLGSLIIDCRQVIQMQDDLVVREDMLTAIGDRCGETDPRADFATPSCGRWQCGGCRPSAQPSRVVE